MKYVSNMLIVLMVTGCSPAAVLQTDADGDAGIAGDQRGAGDSNTPACPAGSLPYLGRCYRATNDLEHCLDRDHDGHQSYFCGGDDLNDFNSSVNPAAEEICGDGYDNDQDGLMDYADTDTCQHVVAPRVWHVDAINGSDDDGVGDGSASAPFASIARANMEVDSGDTVLLYEGDYGDVALVTTPNPYASVDVLENLPPFYTDWVTYAAAPGHEHRARVGRLQIGTAISCPDYNDKYPVDSEYAVYGPLNPTRRDFRIRISGLRVEDGIAIFHGRYVHIDNNIVSRIGPLTGVTDCSDIYQGHTGIEFGGRYIIIENNEVTHSAHGIHGGAHDVIIRNNTVHDITHDGLGLVLGRNYLIEGNDIYNTDDGYDDDEVPGCRIHSDGFQPYIISYEANVNMGYDIRNVSFKRNRIHHTESLGIMLQSSPFAERTDWTAEIKLRNFLFENNIFGPAAGFMVNIIADGFDGFMFRNNTTLRIEGDSYLSAQGRTIQSDSFAVRLSGPNSTDSYIYNNVLSFTADTHATTSFAGYNYFDVPWQTWYDVADWWHDHPGDFFREGDSAPYVTSDFSGHLVDGSPLINAGTRVDASNTPLDVPITEDFYGNPRDNRPDIGAVEVQGLDPPHQLD